MTKTDKQFKKHFNNVRQFHFLFGHPVNMPWRQFVKERYQLRQVLLNEELKEFETATGENNKAEMLDALVDASYIALGTLVEIKATNSPDCYWMQFECMDAYRASRHVAESKGWDFNKAWEIVHHANMSKVGEDGKVHYREDGKVLKPKGWTPPNLEHLVA